MPLHAYAAPKKSVDLLAVDLESVQSPGTTRDTVSTPVTNIDPPAAPSVPILSQPVPHAPVAEEKMQPAEIDSHLQKEKKLPVPEQVTTETKTVVTVEEKPLAAPPAPEQPVTVKTNTETVVVDDIGIKEIADDDIAAVMPVAPMLPHLSGALPSFKPSRVPVLPESNPNSYKIETGDTLRVTVFGEQELTAEYKVDSSGSISLPLVGPVPVKGLDVAQAKAMVEQRLAEGFFVEPNVVVEITKYRPFYIIGEVQGPGSYTYTDGMTVLEAVALSGGYTYRADKDDIEIVRKGYTAEKPYEAKLTDMVMPGDVITVKERFF